MSSTAIPRLRRTTAPERMCTYEVASQRAERWVGKKKSWLRGGDLNPRPLGYEPNELPDCSTPRHVVSGTDRTYELPTAGTTATRTFNCITRRNARSRQPRQATACLLQRRRQLVVILRNLLRSLQRHPQSILLALGRGHLGDEGRPVRWTASELHTIDAHQ